MRNSIECLFQFTGIFHHLRLQYFFSSFHFVFYPKCSTIYSHRERFLSLKEQNTKTGEFINIALNFVDYSCTIFDNFLNLFSNKMRLIRQHVNNEYHRDRHKYCYLSMIVYSKTIKNLFYFEKQQICSEIDL